MVLTVVASCAQGEALMGNFSIVDEAKACGWSGFLTVQGALEAEVSGGHLWGGVGLRGYSHPSYFGMMCASFTPALAGEVTAAAMALAPCAALAPAPAPAPAPARVVAVIEAQRVGNPARGIPEAVNDAPAL